MTVTARPLREVIGERTRTLRETAGKTQDDIARTARRYGLSWSQSRVGLLETGKKSIDAEELLLLPSVLSEALGRVVTITELFDVTGDIALSTTASTPARQISALLNGKRVGGRSLTPNPLGLADEQAARTLGVPRDTWARLCWQLWGRTLTEERDARVGVVTDVGSRSALRGRATRELYAEVRSFVAAQRWRRE